jgi:hypothetical protein
MIGLALVIVYAIQNGDPRRLTHGIDYQGRICGVHGDVLDRPYLFWCREPDEKTVGSTVDFHGGEYPQDLFLREPICVDKCPDSSARMFPCLDKPKITQQATGVPPEVQTVVTVSEQVVDRAGYPTKEFGGHFCIPAFNTTKSPARDELEEYGPLADMGWNTLLAIGGLRHAPLALGVAVAVAVLLGYGYLLALRMFARLLMYTMLAILLVFFLVVGIALLSPLWMPPAFPNQWESVGKAHNPFYNTFDKQVAGRYSSIAGSAFLLLHLIMVCVFCCAHKTIETAIGVIEAACECMFALPTMLLQPIFEVISKVVVLFLLLWGFTYLVSTGHPGSGTEKVFGARVPGLDREFHYDDKGKAMIGYYVFGIFWCMEMLTAMGHFVISYSVVMWYFTPLPKRSIPIPVVRATFNAIYYHLGTLAFGACLIAICRFLRLLFSTLARASEGEGNPLAALIAKILVCCVDCFKRFLEFITKNAYIDVCITSSSFCVAAKHTFDFILREGGKVALLNGACFVFEVLGAFAISMTGGYTTWMLVTNVPAFADNTSDHYVAHPEVCAGAGFLISLTVAAAFMNVFDHTADTLLYTFAWNRNHDHNSAELYCPHSLAVLLEYEPEADRHHHPGDPTKNSGTFGYFSTWFTGKQPEAAVDEHERAPMISYNTRR